VLQKQMSEVRTQHLEDDMRQVKAALARLEPLIVRIDERLTSTLPHLATKAELTTGLTDLRVELAEKPGKTYLWMVLGVLLVAYAAGLAGWPLCCRSSYRITERAADLDPLGTVEGGPKSQN
jgi:hypothetical protein